MLHVYMHVRLKLEVHVYVRDIEYHSIMINYRNQRG